MFRLVILGTLVAGALASPLNVLPDLLTPKYFACNAGSKALCSDKPDTPVNSVQYGTHGILPHCYGVPLTLV